MGFEETLLYVPFKETVEDVFVSMAVLMVKFDVVVHLKVYWKSDLLLERCLSYPDEDIFKETVGRVKKTLSIPFSELPLHINDFDGITRKLIFKRLEDSICN